MERLSAKIRRALDRDRDLPLSTRLAKGQRYLSATTLAPLYLRACDRVGAHARAIGRPRIQNGGHIAVGDDFVVNSTFAVVELVAAAGARIDIGNHVRINYGTLISARRAVRLGNDVSIGPYCIIADADFDATMDAEEVPGGAVEAGPAPIEIGDGAWLAGRVTVLPGTRIGAGSVITAGSVVSGDIPPGVVAGGIPARILRDVHADGHADGHAMDAAAGATAASEVSRDATLAPIVGAPAAPTSTDPAPAALRGVVLADFTVGDLAVRLRDAADAPSLEVVDAPFGQVIPALVQGPPDDARDFVIVWTRPEVVSPVFQRVLEHGAVTEADLVADVDAFCALVLRGAAQYRFGFVPTWTLPSHHRGLGMIDTRPGGAAWALATMNQRLMAQLAPSATVFVLDAQRWLAAAGRGGSSAKGWYLGKVAFQGEVLAEAARDIKAAVRGLTGGMRKLLVLDLDDTLWGGIVGDVGWEQLRLGGHDSVGEAFVDFQRAIKQLTRRGVLLAVVSKNTEAVALEAMRSHPAMVLRPENFVAWRINWHDKARNVADLVAELNLGLQSVVFIDDNPAERARVREALPEVLVPDWPEDKLLYPSTLLALRCFDAPAISREDAARTQLYAAEHERETSRQEVGSLDDWLLSIGLQVRAEPLTPASLPRAAQLLNKTNQMNLSTRRLTEAELRDWAQGPGRALWTLSVSDRFGDAGLTGILGVERDEQAATCRIMDFVLSCRVMGRRIEHTMAHLAVAWAREAGLRHVEAVYLPTAKNKPCHEFWMTSGFEAEPDGQRFTWNVEHAYPLPTPVALRWDR